MLITKQMLEDKGGCGNQVEIFAKEWPAGMEVTAENCLRLADLHLNVDWAARNLLTATAFKAYEKARDQVREAYQKAITPTWEAREKVKAQALEAYEKTIVPAWEAYEKAIGPAWEVYEKDRAQAFYEAAIAKFGPKPEEKP